jgi:hypothetical protein
MQLLCVIEDVFEISGRGCVVVPGVPHGLPVPLSPGARVLIEAPTGKKFEIEIAGFEMVNRGRPLSHVPFLVKNVAKDALPIGSRVFLGDTETHSRQWRFSGICAEGESVSVGGVNPWGRAWRALGEPPITVSHPSYPEQLQVLRLYKVEASGGQVTFAAGEVSNGVWLFYAEA